MGESEVTKPGLNVNKNEKDGSPRALNPAISTFLMQLPHKFQNILKSRLSRLAKNDGTNWVSSVQRNKNWPFSASEAELDEQLQAWRENPSWADNTMKNVFKL